MYNNTTINQFESTAKQKGDSLERAVEHIFSVAGFKTARNIIIAKYEVDVLAEIGDRRIIIECKNYQNSTLTIRNLIHQWNSKNQVIKAHKIIIALAGLTIKDSDYKLASEFDIELWNQDDISDLFNISLKPDILKRLLIEKVDMTPITIAERYRDDITYLVIKPLLSDYSYTEEGLYKRFNKYLRAHILTELQMTETTPEERSNLIKLFEGSKTKKAFLNLVTKKRKEIEYWNIVYEQLKSNDIISRDQQNYYINHMDELLYEYASQKEFFQSDDYNLKLQKLISVRLQNALHKNQNCCFKTYSMSNSVKVSFDESDLIEIHITAIGQTECNILNWILTSEGTPAINKNGDIYAYYWSCSSLKDTTDKIYRIFTEYYEVNKKSPLKDTQIV